MNAGWIGRVGLAVLLLASSVSRACSCDALPPEEASVLFSGPIESSFDVLGRRYYVVKAVRAWKGLIFSRTLVRGSGDVGCDVGFEAGKSYLLAGSEVAGRLVFDRCSGTRELAVGEEPRLPTPFAERSPVPVAVPFGIATVGLGVLPWILLGRRLRTRKES